MSKPLRSNSFTVSSIWVCEWKTLPMEKGRYLLKEVRTRLIETARRRMEAVIEDITGVKVVSLHHDISTGTGEEVVIFTLAAVPSVRETKQQ